MAEEPTVGAWAESPTVDIDNLVRSFPRALTGAVSQREQNPQYFLAEA